MHWLKEAQVIVLFTYACITVLLMVFSIARRLQIPDVLHSSRCVASKTVTLFCLTVLPVSMVLAASALSHPVDLQTMVWYLVGTGAFLVCTLIDDTVIITKYGLVFPSAMSPSRLGWNQITDYVVRPRYWRQRFTIIWKDDAGTFQRFEFYTSRRMSDRIDRAVETRGLMKVPVGNRKKALSRV